MSGKKRFFDHQIICRIISLKVYQELVQATKLTTFFPWNSLRTLHLHYCIMNYRWISDRNRNTNKQAYYIYYYVYLRYFYLYIIKTAKLYVYVLSLLILVSISIGNPPIGTISQVPTRKRRNQSDGDRVHDGNTVHIGK